MSSEIAYLATAIDVQRERIRNLKRTRSHRMVEEAKTRLKALRAELRKAEKGVTR